MSVANQTLIVYVSDLATEDLLGKIENVARGNVVTIGDNGRGEKKLFVRPRYKLNPREQDEILRMVRKMARCYWS